MNGKDFMHTLVSSLSSLYVILPLALSPFPPPLFLLPLIHTPPPFSSIPFLQPSLLPPPSQLFILPPTFSNPPPPLTVSPSKPCPSPFPFTLSTPLPTLPHPFNTSSLCSSSPSQSLPLLPHPLNPSPFSLNLSNPLPTLLPHLFNPFPLPPTPSPSQPLPFPFSLTFSTVILLYNCPTSREGLLHCSLEALEHLFVPPWLLGCRDNNRCLFQLPLLFLKGWGV